MGLIATLGLVLFLTITISKQYPQQSRTTKIPEILEYQSRIDRDKPGHYNFFYKTSDGIVRKETGELLSGSNNASEEPILHVRGFYSYKGDDGRKYNVGYEADDKGFRSSTNVENASPEKTVTVTLTPSNVTVQPPTPVMRPPLPALEISSAAIGSLTGR